MSRIFFAFSLLILVALSSPAEAELMDRSEEHEGFFLRMSLGPSTLGLSQGNSSIDGTGAAFAVAIGGAIAPNLILFGEILSVSTTGPTLSGGSQSQATGRDASFVAASIGPGLNYYIMPANIYLSAALHFTELGISDGYSTGETDMGTGLRFALGKEWWVGRSWGLGIAANASWASIPAKGDSSGPSSTATSFGLAFSATYN